MKTKVLLLLLSMQSTCFAGCPEFETALQKSLARIQKRFMDGAQNNVPEKALYSLENKTTDLDVNACREARPEAQAKSDVVIDS